MSIPEEMVANNVATTPSTSSRRPASVVRFGSSSSRTPAVLLFNDSRCYLFLVRPEARKSNVHE